MTNNEIEEITNNLNSTGIDHELLLKRAKAFRSAGDLISALNDTRSSLHIKESDAGKIMLQVLLKEIAQQKNPNSIESLMADMQDLEIPNKRLEATKKLLYLVQDPGVCETFATIENFKMLLSLAQMDMESEIRLKFLQLLGAISSFSDIVDFFVENTDAETLANLLTENDDSNMQFATDCFATYLGNYARQNSDSIEKSQHLIKVYYDRCQNKRSENIQLSAYKGLIKILMNERLVLNFLSLDNLDILKNLYSKSENYQSITVAILACCFSQVSGPNEEKITKLFQDAIVQLIDTNQQKLGLMALSTLFQANPKVGGTILLKEGFLDNILEIIDMEPEDVQYLTVEVLSSACNLPEAKKLIAEKSSGYLIKCLNKKTAEKLRIVASLTLVKIMSIDPAVQRELLTKENIGTFFSEILNDKNSSPSNKSAAIEALAYLSVHPSVKEKIVNDKNLIISLKALAQNGDRTTQYGIVLIISNLTMYRKKLTEEEKQLKKLHKFANNAPEEDPLDNDDNVAKRITKLVGENILPVLVAIKPDSDNFKEAIANIFLNIATNVPLRGAIVQSGAIKVLLKIAISPNVNVGMIAAHAIAKVGVTTNPALAFKGELASEVIRPLMNVIVNSNSGLAKFESLLAITNLAGMDDVVRNRIVQLDGLATLLSLQFSDHHLIRRAATEALCNMIFHPVVFAKYMDKKVDQPLQIMVALSDDDDDMTRRAASGLIAVLSSEPEAIPLIVTHKRIFEILTNLMASENEELIHRASEIIKNISAIERYCKLIPIDTLENVKMYVGYKNQAVAQSCEIILRNAAAIGIKV
ncbi:Protein unc-45 A [Boothiomyces sp. JEL0866]|nr:Protein unc-45 A [Boothiomyces sp. JEL0866]